MIAGVPFTLTGLSKPSFVILFHQETWYWQGDSSADSVVMSGVRCSGTELTLDQCLHHGKHVDCPRGGGRFAAGVSCTQSKTEH